MTFVKIAALKKSSRDDDYRVRTCTLSSMENIDVRGGSIKNKSNRCSCYGKNITSNEEELQRLRDMLKRVSKPTRRGGLSILDINAGWNKIC